MRSDVVRRVRWGNVALACTVLAALVGVVVWPLVSTGPPGLPPDAARPFVAGEPPTPASGPDEGNGEERRRAGEGDGRRGQERERVRRETERRGRQRERTSRRGRRGTERHGRDRRARPRTPRRSDRRAPARPPRTVVVVPPPMPARPTDTAGGEFGFERPPS